jgi:hypothetical protein
MMRDTRRTSKLTSLSPLRPGSAPTPNILSHSSFPDSPYIRDSTLTKAGPYHDFPGLTELGLENFEVHYQFTEPLISARTLKRAVEVRFRTDRLEPRTAG